MSVAQVRANALAAARAATASGFLTEPNVDWLMRRAWIAALRLIARSEHPQARRLAGEWTPWAPWALDPGDIDWAQLPSDGPAERILLDPDYDSVVEHFDCGPTPDEPEGLVAARRLGMRAAVVLEAKADRFDQWTVVRVSLGGHDRWFRYWGGKAQDGNWDLEPPVPSSRAARRAEALYWAEVTSTCVGQVHDLSVHADARTAGAVEKIVRSYWPEANIRRIS